LSIVSVRQLDLFAKPCAQTHTQNVDDKVHK